MIEMIIGSAIYAAAFQTSAADGARTAFRTCIKQASTEAKGQKVANDAFAGFVKTKCAAQETSFRSAVWAFDSKNKVPKRQSDSDMQIQIDDFMSMAADKYASDNAP